MAGEPDQIKWRGVRPVSGIDGVWPERDATRVHARTINDTESSVDVYTVPAGKKMYLSNLLLCVYLAEDKETRSRVTVVNAGDVLQYYVAEVRFDKAGQIAVPQHFMPALELTAGWKVVLTNEIL